MLKVLDWLDSDDNEYPREEHFAQMIGLQHTWPTYLFRALDVGKEPVC